MRDIEKTCTVELSAIDALSVGQSLRALARNMNTPHGTREFYARVGDRLVSSARLTLASKGEP